MIWYVSSNLSSNPYFFLLQFLGMFRFHFLFYKKSNFSVKPFSFELYAEAMWCYIRIAVHDDANVWPFSYWRIYNMNEVVIDHESYTHVITACSSFMYLSRVMCLRLAQPPSLFIVLTFTWFTKGSCC
jgi:hypothetical protein